ncbi:N-acetyltransferase-like protein [Cercophora newfieldiana]|uniref:N-acetyltransferase-like protein n=1 Tax=Cercophora newfieldiana TaxID=92897 RepID=A0AA40CLI2_9PEZI|nr:N-acetyltransferase-like protein [Cercophora newfieldiana]
MALQDPRVRIREATPADANAMAEIQLAAFGTDVINQLLYPGEITEDAKTKAAESLFAPPEPPHQSSEPLLVVAELVLENGPEVIAFAKWSLRRESVPEEEWDVEPSVSPDMLGEGSNIEVFKWFHLTLHRKLRSFSRGEAMLYLEVLVCAPHRQRLGAGFALVRWGVDLADRLGLVCWVEGSAYSYRLYMRYGFDDVTVVDLRVTETWGVVKPEDQDWGGNLALEIGRSLPVGELRTVIMKRLPSPGSLQL